MLKLASGIHVREARLDGEDALGGFVPVSGSGTLEIVLSSSSGRLEGIIRDEKGRPTGGAQAVLVPDRARSRIDLFKETISDQNGRFAFSSIPPGDYTLFAWEDLEPYTYFDPDVLEKYAEKGRHVHIGESSRETLDVTAIPAGVE
jgi:hypothetical protein